MILGNAAWGLRETSLEEQLMITSRMGLSLLELSIAGYEKDYLQLDSGNIKILEVKAKFEDYGINPDCACTGNDFTVDAVNEQLDKVKQVIDIAAQLGVKYLRIFAGFSSDSVVYGKRFERLMEALRQTAGHAKKCDILPVVETHGGVIANGEALVHFGSVTTRSDYWRQILETGVAINYDPANLAAVGSTDPVAFYHEFADSIKYVHLKDFRSVPGGVLPAACGEGRLDWVKLMRALADFSGPALIEYELTQDVKDGLTRSMNFLNQWR